MRPIKRVCVTAGTILVSAAMIFDVWQKYGWFAAIGCAGAILLVIAVVLDSIEKEHENPDC